MKATVTQWFEGCVDMAQLKARYRELVLKHHPDRGGDTATMQVINGEYERLFARMKDAHNASVDEERKTNPHSKKQYTTEVPADFIAAVDAAIKCGLDVEVCGSWVWLSGDTRPYKETLKAVGFRWSKDKCRWYLAPTGYRRASGWSMEHIRMVHGSKWVSSGGEGIVQR